MMERKLETAVDLLEILMNFLLFIGLETVADAALNGGKTPVYVLFIPLAAPVLFYLFRRMLNNLPLFLLAHIAVVAALCWLGGFCPMPLLWRIAFTAVGVIYVIISMQIRLKKQEDGEGENAAGFMGVAAVAAFFACSYFGSEAGGARILWLVLVWLAGHWMRSYLANFLGYLQMNRRAAGAMPEKRIFQGGVISAAVYGAFSMVVLTLCSRAALLDKMSALVKQAGLFLLRAFVNFLALFGSETPVEEEMQMPQNTGMQQMMMLPEAEDAPWWMELLDKIVMTAVAIVAIVAIIMLVVMLIRLMIQSFYGRKREKKEIRQEGYVEEEERLERKRNRPEKKIPMVGGTPQQRVRRVFKKTVQQFIKAEGSAPKGSNAANSRLLLDMSEIRKMEEEEREGKAPSGTGALYAKTARELVALCVKGKGSSQEGREEWNAFAALYEKARYAQETVTKEDAKEAARLAGRLGR